ncbi:hypothetical protein JTE90_001228 [Oedothorax gibbosus]|uniref:Uncharacterized protein n=1 Tax=Oedothorax gibbosus TaxID=931172 RepID=A0AAV6UVM6_9ARAC|nr:hypothetical protein JTE90_001228 [Oedothorax gibbosus]
MNYMRAILLALCVILTAYKIGVSASPAASSNDPYDPEYYFPAYFNGGDKTTDVKTQNNCNSRQEGAGILDLLPQSILSPCINVQH